MEHDPNYEELLEEYVENWPSVARSCLYLVLREHELLTHQSALAVARVVDLKNRLIEVSEIVEE